MDPVELTTKNHQNELNTSKPEIELIHLQLYYALHEQSKTQFARRLWFASLQIKNEFSQTP